MKCGYPPDYVMDRMPMYEAKTVVEFAWYKSQENWEQARLQAYVTAQCNSSKKMRMSDIAKFPWESDNNKAGEMMSDEQMAEMKTQAKWFLDNKMI